jgi:hypothetical protein
MGELVQVPIAKAGNRPIDIDIDELPDAMYRLCVAEGLKVLLNKRMSKVGSVTKLTGDDQAKAYDMAFKIAEENALQLMSGEIRVASAKSATKVAAIVMTEARRLAKEVVKNTIRAAGMKVSHVEASQITAAANELIASDPSFIEQAEVAIESRKAKTSTDKAEAEALIAKLGGVVESPKLVAKAAKDKAERKTQLSAKQAGLPKAPKRKPEQTIHMPN